MGRDEKQAASRSTWSCRADRPCRRTAGAGDSVQLNGYRVDFYWPDLGLVVEADSLRYHRTAAKQAAGQRRDQAHSAAGLTPLRFTHRQVFHEPEHVRRTLEDTAAHLARTDAMGVGDS